MRLIKIGIANVNSTVGSVKSNTAKVIAQGRLMRAAGVTVACFPEQVVGGYAPEDLVQWRGFVDAQWAALQEIALALGEGGMVSVVGLTVSHRGHLYNCAAVLHAGRVVGIVPKEKLPTYNVFYELRTFSQGSVGLRSEIHGVPFGDLVFDCDFGTFAIEVCEDVWSPDGPMRRRCYAGAELVVNVSASPFRTGVVSTRREMLSTRSADNACVHVYANLVGANDGLIFDGGGWVFSGGRPVFEAPRFREGWHATVVDLDRPARLRTESTTWRMDARAYLAEHGEQPRVALSAATADRSGLAYPMPAHKSFFTPAAVTPRSARADFCEDLLDALALGVGDYFEKTRVFKGIGVALSGGRDSMLTLLIAARYLEWRYADLPASERRARVSEHLHAFYMPSRFSSDATHAAAEQIAKDVGARFLVVPIEEAFNREEDVTRTMLGGEAPTHLTQQNIQARLRGQRMWNWANSSGFLFLQSGNMSEKAMGYTTIGGDLEGALAVLANVPKTVVIYLLEYLLESRGLEGIRLCFQAPAGPELAADQSGEAELMPFRALDACFHLYAAEKLHPGEMVQALDSMFPDDPPGSHDLWVTKFVRLFTANIYKWVQAPLSLHVGNLDLDRERALQLPVVQTTEWTR